MYFFLFCFCQFCSFFCFLSFFYFPLYFHFFLFFYIFKLGQRHPTRRNRAGGQTHATYCAQQCCIDMLRSFGWGVAYFPQAKLDTETNVSRNVLSQCHLELCDFAKNYILHCSMCPILYQSIFFQVLLSVTPKCSRGNWWNDAHDRPSLSLKREWSLLLYFAIHCLEGNIQRKFQ